MTVARVVWASKTVMKNDAASRANFAKVRASGPWGLLLSARKAASAYSTAMNSVVPA